MKMIQKVVLLLGVLLFSVEGFSQKTDTISKSNKDSLNIPKRTIVYAADKLAIVRPLNIEFTHSAPYNFTSERGNTSLPESRVESFSQAKISANFNFIKRKTWLLGATLNYRYTSVEANMVDPFTENATTLDDDFHYLSSSLNFSYFSTLFKKRTIYSSSIIVDGSDQHFERVKGLLTGVIVLKANQKTKMTVGLLVNIDPSAQTPVVPIFTYEFKFNNGLIADITLPKSIYLRKNVFNAGRVSLGTELDRTSFYLYNIDGTSQRFEYRQLDINSGLIYEHAIGDFVFTGKTGMKLTPSGRLFRKEDSFKEAVYEINPNTTFYFNLGVSFNPFTVLGKKK
ncbi:hypothetical protein [Flavobacterium flavipallidum]|uniref:Outer membrane protein beta-barrel domain-containing protein n=1 Tax=Flavobacterium flavipallidum TaxID=3139140 RepID=A0ABU9HQ50_9FLAO